jgi:hypothetical protein
MDEVRNLRARLEIIELLIKISESFNTVEAWKHYCKKIMEDGG